MQELLVRKGVSPRTQSLCLAVWLFSPFTVAVSTRGNGEALVTCMLLAMLTLLQSGDREGWKIKFAAFWWSSAGKNLP